MSKDDLPDPKESINLSGLMTEAASNHDGLENMTLNEIFSAINQEDMSVPKAIKKAIPQIEALTSAIVERMEHGGRLFYIGAGTSGRLGVVDASECPPTFGVDFDTVIGLIAGGDGAIRRSVEGAEDDMEAAWKDLRAHHIGRNDIVVGIAASGRTPYVIGGLQKARERGILTGCIVCNNNSPIAAASHHPVEIIVGPEFLTGSTRMKAGTAQKLVLNMISTATMIKLGHVQGNRMVDMKLSNQKLVERATTTLMEMAGIERKEAEKLLQKHKSIKKALKAAPRKPS